MLRTAGDPAAAEPLIREYNSILTNVLDEHHRSLIQAKGVLGDCLWQQGKFASADSFYVETLTLHRQHQPSGEPALQVIPVKLAKTRQSQGDDAGAEAVIHEALAWAGEMYGDRSPEVASVLNYIAFSYYPKGDGQVNAQREALSILRSLHGGDHPEVANGMALMARALSWRGNRERSDFEAADTLYRDAQDMLQRFHDGEIPWRIQEGICRRWGVAMLAQGRADEAEPILRQAVEVARSHSEEGMIENAWAQSAYGACLTALGRYAEAESLLVDSYEILRVRIRGTSPVPRLRGGLRPTVERLIDLYGRLGDVEQVRQFEQELRTIDAPLKRNE